jgi:UDPglucose 6-dehydrogenase
MRIAMIGTGYAGLVSGAGLAHIGHEVVCVDADATKVERLAAGESTIYEPGLAELMAPLRQAGRLRFTMAAGPAVAAADAVFLTVGTPGGERDGQADLGQIIAAARDVATALTGYTGVITKSTVPVGTNRKIAAIIRAARPDADFDMISNPEFLREGSAVADFLRPDRIVAGVETARAAELVDAIYRPLIEAGAPILFTDLESAEMTKYAANAYLAARITFINEVAALCERVGADVGAVARGMGFDRRIGPAFLQPGPGFGGSCFPKDTRALAATARMAGSPLGVLEAVIEGNDRVRARMVDKIVDLCGGEVAGRTVAVLGATFKAGTDDMREAASLTIVPALLRAGARVRIVDPQAGAAAAELLRGAEWSRNATEAADGADALAILTDWEEFRRLDLGTLARRMASPRMADLRNLFDPDEVLAAGFVAYAGVGRPDALMPGLGR